MRFGGSMASLIVPKWMRSEFRSDIITRPRGYLAPARNKLQPLGCLDGYKNLRYRRARSAKMASKQRLVKSTSTVLLPIQYFSIKLQLKISLPTSYKGRD